MMDFDEIARILEMMREHELSEFELERDNFKLRIRKHSGGHWVAATPHPHDHGTAEPPPVPGSAAAALAAAGASVLAPVDEEIDLAVVKAPIVGTFYRASEPGAKPFAEVGDVVRRLDPRRGEVEEPLAPPGLSRDAHAPLPSHFYDAEPWMGAEDEPPF